MFIYLLSASGCPKSLLIERDLREMDAREEGLQHTGRIFTDDVPGCLITSEGNYCRRDVAEQPSGIMISIARFTGSRLFFFNGILYMWWWEWCSCDNSFSFCSAGVLRFIPCQGCELDPLDDIAASANGLLSSRARE